MKALCFFMFCGAASLLCGCATPRKIQVGSIGSEYVLVGRFGIPLGETFEIEATPLPDPDRDLPKQSLRNWLRVIAINGRRLKQPEEIPVWQGDFDHSGKLLRLRVYEDARYQHDLPPNLNAAELDTTPAQQILSTGLCILDQLSPAVPSTEGRTNP